MKSFFSLIKVFAGNQEKKGAYAAFNEALGDIKCTLSIICLSMVSNTSKKIY
jgi:hypothetical protein